MKKTTLIWVLTLCTTLAAAQTSLTVGDIAFVGTGTDGITNADDAISFVLLKDIDAATEIIFTDRGWNDGTGFYEAVGDGDFTWTSGVARTAGEVITLDLGNLQPLAASLTTLGDQLFAIQGSIASPTFIAGLHFNDTPASDDANWDGAATDNQTSALPDALESGVTAIRLTPEADNWQYSCSLGTCPLSGTQAEILAALNNVSNWASDDASLFSTTADASLVVTISSPEPDPTISVNDVTVNEFDGTLTFILTKTGTTTLDGSVDFTINPGTATTPADYAGLLSGTITFLAADTEQFVTVEIVDDAVVETTEQFTIDLSNGQNLALADDQGVGTILDDESEGLVINEVDANNAGFDIAEFVELYDGGTGNTALDGLVLVFFNGGSDLSYTALDLDGLTTNADGYFVAGNASVSETDLVFPDSGLQNGPDAVALYVGDGADFPAGTAPTSDGLLDAIVYDTGATPENGDDAELLSGLGQTIQYDEDANGNDEGESNSMVPNGTGDFVAQRPTPGAVNEVVCGIPALTSEEFDTALNTLTLVFSAEDIDGLTTVNFTVLNNLTVINSAGFTSGDGSNWTAPATNPATATFVLSLVDASNPSAAYNVDITNVCGETSSAQGTIDASPPPPLIITEIMYNPASAEDDWEWVEVYNAGSEDLDLTGFVIDDANGTFHTVANIAAGIVPANGSAVLFNADDVSASDFAAAWGDVNLIPVTNWGAMALNNGGDNVAIWQDFVAYSGDENTYANAVDIVAYDDDGVVWPLEDGLASIFLTDLTADNSIGSNWALSTDGATTPVFDAYTSDAAGGNIGGEVASPGTPAGPPLLDDLFISEYIEGSSLNKALEIFNGTGASIDLAAGNYAIEFYYNGNSTAGASIALTGIVANRDVYILADDGAEAAIIDEADQTATPGFYNGNDAVALLKDGVIIDVIGQIGFDPGSEWLENGVGTQNETLRRKSSVTSGDTDGSNVFDPSAEWDTFALDTLDGLGTHTVDGIPPANTFAIVATDAVKAEGDSGTTNFDFTVSRTGDLSLTTTVDFVVSGGADATDFGGSFPTGTLTLNPGESEISLTVPVSGDTDPEPDEPFTVTLSNPARAELLLNPTAEGTIQDDDTAAMLTLISAIQGNGPASPMAGNVVTIEGVVTGDFQDGDADDSRNLRGFYVQEEDSDSDGDSQTSEGIFVFENGDTSADVSVGDLVQVTGTVEEFFGETQIGTVTNITVTGSGAGAVTPTALSLPFTQVTTNSSGQTIPDLEPFEGMWVSIAQNLTVQEYFEYDRFGEIRLIEGDRPYQFTQRNAPDAAGFAAQQEFLAKRGIVFDDGQAIQNPDPLVYPAPGFSDANGFRGGDAVSGLSGNVRFSRGSGGSGTETYRIEPVSDPVFTSQNPRPATPDEVGGSLKVSSFNVLNYFATIDAPGATTAIGGEPRGADDATELERQTDKLVRGILDVDADILGLVELENDFLPGSTGNAIEKLVNELNAVSGAGTYAWVNPGTQFVGDDDIAVGIIFKPAAVSLAGAPAILDTPAFLDPNSSGQTRNRAALAQSFEETASGEVFTLAVNHFKSKGQSGAGVAADADQGDGQGPWNDTRTKAAQALVAWLGTDPTSSSDPDFMIVGDLNAYAAEDPIKALEAAGYTDVSAIFAGGSAYNFLFDGQLGTLDYVLVNDPLLAQVTGATNWHVNADEPKALDYNLDFGRNPSLFNGSNPYRNSDHDPVVVGLNLVPAKILPKVVINEIHYDPAPEITGDANGDGLRDASADEFVELLNLEATDVDISGWTLSDAVAIRHTFPDGTVLAGNCGVVVFGGGAPSGAFGEMLVQLASSGLIGLNNGGDLVELQDSEGTVVASFTYAGGTGTDQSITRDPDGTGSFVAHSTATGSGGSLFSPGTQIDGSSFSGCAAPDKLFFADLDFDGYVDPGNAVWAASAPEGFIEVEENTFAFRLDNFYGVGVSADLSLTGGELIYTLDGTAALLTGVLEFQSGPFEGTLWEVNLDFTSKLAETQPDKSLLPPGAFVENGGLIDPSEWILYLIEEGASLKEVVRPGEFTGRQISLERLPADGTLGMQLGQGANGKNLGYGAYAAFYWEFESNSSSGIFNIDVQPDCNDASCAFENSQSAAARDALMGLADCNDLDTSINPGASETCDGKDNDCDGEVDEIPECDPVLSVLEFRLVDATSDLELFTITNGMEINIDDLPTDQLNIVAVTTEDVESVFLDLTGARDSDRTENFVPYALFGDSSGNFAGSELPLGAYNLNATPYSGDNMSGDAGTALSIAFNLIQGDPAADLTPPIITLLGANPQPIMLNEPYVELGATATDNVDGDLSGSIVIDAGAVDTSRPGSYQVTYDVTDAAGNAAITRIRTVEVVEEGEAAGPLQVLDARNDSFLFNLTDGLVIYQTDVGGIPLGVVFNTDLNPGGVQFNLSGPLTENRFEGPEPHSLFGDIGVDIQGKVFPIGDYTLVATPNNGPVVTVNFSVVDRDPSCPIVSLDPFAPVLDTDTPFVLTGGSPSGGTYSGPGVSDGTFDPANVGPGSYTITYTRTEGDCTESASANIEVRSATALQVTGFWLVDADADTDIMELTPGMEIDVTTLPTVNLNIRAAASTDSESVQLELSGALASSRTENFAPYALFGDLSGDYNGQLLPLGAYTLTAQAYAGNNASGASGIAGAVDFSLVMGDASASKQQRLEMSLSPNAASVEVQLSFSQPVRVRQIAVFDMTGRLLRTSGSSSTVESARHSLGVQMLPEGVYMLKVTDSRGVQYTEKLVVKR